MGIFFPEELEIIEKQRRAAEGRILVQGCLSFVAREPGKPGRLLSVGENLVVNEGKQSLAKLFGLTALAGTYPAVAGVSDIGYFAVGDGGLSPLPTTNALINELTGGAVPRPTFIVSLPPPGPPHVTMLAVAQIGTSDLNGFNIDEAAIFSQDNTTMFAARGFGAIAKTAAYALEGRWTITF